MGKEDIKWKAYLEDTRRYADLWNGAIFHGKQMLKPEELQVISPVLNKASDNQVLEKTRDLVMMQTRMGQCFAVYAVESQENIDYSMPARIMIQEALEYNGQLRRIMRENERKEQEYRAGHREQVYQNTGERLYRVRKTDSLYPVVTLLIYWGESEWDGPKTLHEMMNFGEKDTALVTELRRLIPEYPLHFLNLTDFKHFEHFKTELRPLLELYQKRNHKEAFVDYLKNGRNYISMNDESWYLLSSLTNSQGIRKLVQEKIQKREGSNIMCRAFDEWEADCRAEGRNEGRIESKAEDIIELLEEHGSVTDELKSHIFSQNDLSLLQRWFKLAARAGSIKEFECQINT